MRSRIAAAGVMFALVTGFAGVGAIALAGTGVGEEAPLEAATPRATAPAFPTSEDHCYIENMLVHHEQALELSSLVLDAADVRERTRALADFIAVDQATEIDTMRAWQEAWGRAVSAGPPASSGHGAHGAAAVGEIPSGCGEHTHTQMGGMASPDQLSALSAAEGAAADRLFLELMIVHHEGALEMATRAVIDGSNAFVKSSGKHVLVEQEREIVAMSALLAELG